MTEIALLALGLAIGLTIGFLLFRRGQAHGPPTSLRASEPSDAPSVTPEPWALLDQICEGVLLLDDRLRPILANAAAGRILGLQGTDLPARLPSEEVVVVARSALEDGTEVEELLTLWYPTRSRIKARAMPLGAGNNVLLILQDVTEESLSQQIRREFVAHASHELKTPVASLQVLAEAVHQAAEDDPAAVGRFSHKMVTEATRLGRLISDLLDLSKLEDPARIPDEPADVSEIARSEVAQARTLADAKHMEIKTSIETDVWVLGDEQQLGLMIRNLLENAVRYTPERGRLSIEVGIVAGSAVLSVSDDGIGIPLEAQGRIFERFYRVDRARSRDRGGTGLGLAIVKHVAELHGGDVSLRSQLGEGSTFTIRIPALPQQPEAESIAG